MLHVIGRWKVAIINSTTFPERVGKDTRNPTHLLIDGCVPTRNAHPDVFVESVADGITNINGWIVEGTKNGSGL